MCLQVRCFVGDNEDRWFMWYSGRGRGDAGMDAIAPAAGSIGPLFAADLRVALSSVHGHAYSAKQ